MSEIDKARDAATVQCDHEWLGSYLIPRCGKCGHTEATILWLNRGIRQGFDAGLATATAKIEALEAKLATAERLINEINDARAANWHLQRRRENDQFEWFSSTADSVFGPFPTALEAFAAVRKESPKQGTISDMSTGYTGLITSKENTDA